MSDSEAARREEERLLRVMNRTSSAKAPTFKPAPKSDPPAAKPAATKTYAYQRKQEEARKAADVKRVDPPKPTPTPASTPARPTRQPSEAETFEERMKRERDEWRKKTQPFRWALEDPENRVDQLQDLIEDPVEDLIPATPPVATSKPVHATSTPVTTSKTELVSAAALSCRTCGAACSIGQKFCGACGSTNPTSPAAETTPKSTPAAAPATTYGSSLHDLVADLDNLVVEESEAVKLRRKHLTEAGNEATIALTAMDSSTPDKKAIMGFIKKMALASQEGSKLLTEESLAHEVACTAFIEKLKLVLVRAKTYLTGGDKEPLAAAIVAWQQDLAKLQAC